MRHMKLRLTDGETAPRVAEVEIRNAVIAGWTGRDREALEKHITELEALGVKRPETTPIFYRVAAARLTAFPAIEVLGHESSGEVEFVLLQAEEKLWVGVGSDHTDRNVEAYNVSVSKQICDKPVGNTFWAYDDVADHWDELILRSYVLENGTKRLYQEGNVTAMLPPRELIAQFGAWEEGTIMFCGTLAVMGEFATGAREFDLELEDGRKNRVLNHRYEIVTLPLMG